MRAIEALAGLGAPTGVAVVDAAEIRLFCQKSSEFQRHEMEALLVRSVRRRRRRDL